MPTTQPMMMFLSFLESPREGAVVCDSDAVIVRVELPSTSSVTIFRLVVRNVEPSDMNSVCTVCVTVSIRDVGAIAVGVASVDGGVVLVGSVTLLLVLVLVGVGSASVLLVSLLFDVLLLDILLADVLLTTLALLLPLSLLPLSLDVLLDVLLLSALLLSSALLLVALLLSSELLLAALLLSSELLAALLSVLTRPLELVLLSALLGSGVSAVGLDPLELNELFIICASTTFSAPATRRSLNVLICVPEECPPIS